MVTERDAGTKAAAAVRAAAEALGVPAEYADRYMHIDRSAYGTVLRIDRHAEMAPFEERAVYLVDGTGAVDRETDAVETLARRWRLDALPPATGRRYQCHHVVAEALRSGRFPGTLAGTAVVVEGRDRIERYANAVTTARIDLGRGVVFSQADTMCHVDMPGNLPSTLRRALPGMRASEIIEHPWLDRPDLLVSTCSTVGTRTRLELTFAWDAVDVP